MHILRERGYTTRPIDMMRVKDLVQVLIETDAGRTEGGDDGDDGNEDDDDEKMMTQKIILRR